MSDYDYDAAMDQLAEWDAEELMDEYDDEQWQRYTDSPPIIAWWTNEEVDQEDTENVLATQTVAENILLSDQKHTVDVIQTETLLQKIEKEGEQKITQLLEKNEPIDTETCVNIMQQGADEFKNNTGRNITYSEIRNAFG